MTPVCGRFTAGIMYETIISDSAAQGEPPASRTNSGVHLRFIAIRL
jgi:hypothetical protein